MRDQAYDATRTAFVAAGSSGDDRRAVGLRDLHPDVRIPPEEIAPSDRRQGTGIEATRSDGPADAYASWFRGDRLAPDHRLDEKDGSLFPVRTGSDDLNSAQWLEALG